MAILPPSSIATLFQPLSSGSNSGSLSLFGNRGNTFQGVSIGGSLLNQAANARIEQQVARLLDPDDFKLQQGPDIQRTPFDEPEDERGIRAQAREVLRKDSLIDFDNRIVADAANEPDAQATFVLYNALRDLEVLAEAASEKTATDDFRARLDERFQAGLEEVRRFINDNRSEQLFLQSGERGFSTKSETSVGRVSSFVDGAIIQTGAKGSPVPGIEGDEVFELDITGSDGFNTRVTVDLATISGDVTVDALKEALNAAITSVPKRDDLGNVVVDDDGNPEPRFISRFEVFENDDGDFGLEFRGSTFEDVRFVPPAGTEPGLVVAGSQGPLIGEGAQTGLLAEFSDLFGDLTAGEVSDFQSVDPFATETARAEANERAKEFDPLGLTDDDFVLPSIRDAQNAVVGAETTIRDMAVDSDGFVYVVGSAQGNLGQNLNVAEQDDLFLSKLDSSGKVIFSRSLGVSKDADGVALAIDSRDNVVVTGRTTDEATEGDVFSGTDTLVAKFDGEGGELFRRQFDSPADDEGLTVSVGANDEIFIGGLVRPNQIGSFTPTSDARLLRLDGDTGEITDEAVFGTTGDDRVVDTVRANDGSLLVLSEEDGRAVLSKRDAADLSTEVARLDLGVLGEGGAAGRLTVDPGDGSIYVTGTTANAGFTGGGATQANAPSGGQDGFLLRVADNGASLASDYLSFVGSSGTDSLNDVVVSGGKVFVTGTGKGSVEGAERSGSQDAFVARLDAATGAVEEVEQVGKTLTNFTGDALAFVPTGRSVIEKLGFAQGKIVQDQPRDIVSRAAVRDGDSFFIRAGNGPAKRITIESGDTLRDLARQINVAVFRGARAEQQPGSNALRIEALEGQSVQLLAGPEGRDALARLGLDPETLYGKDISLGLGDDDDDAGGSDLGGTFAFNLNQPLNLKDGAAAKFSLKQIESAVSTSQRAFRSLIPNPLKDLLEQRQNMSGTPSPAQQARIANLQSGLERLQSSQQQLAFGNPLSLLV
ncbi:beta-propeller repeat-containing protein [Rhodothalassium salexigens DSM 2132]|uniref:Beta-propeller repeat-containing protein n=1 Tax=Rhodothalassium salexigens DSM 2132 TaxID=1188247 RepID=A0A4R2PPV8_RHOSA|nr:SBBP repeat-containing protein [Rhodothalassium salexigens]MBB4211113.1 hypothetical protein [Rhodothalassium salexigens DSM 2132]MBK1637454.1 hypothetical protein [Rhodothalassium salexigens DSM 2132]TCP36231.1 beta-propeller repeat-containing protein [Rhodothalassium salexigens DSM 2132]